MKTIEFEVSDHADLIKYLEMLKTYIKQTKRKESSNPHHKWDDTTYDIMRIDRLLDIIKGRVYSRGYVIAKPSKTMLNDEDDGSDDLFSFLKG